MPTPEVVRDGLLLFRRQAWRSAYLALAATDQHDLGPDELEVLATAAYLAGAEAASDAAWTRAFHLWLSRGRERRAARCAFWLAFRLLNAGDLPQGGGWVGRARRLLDPASECVELGYITYLSGLQAIFDGDAAVASEQFGRATAIGERFGEADLVTLARLGHGRALIYLGDTSDGISLLDEAMVAITAGEVSAVIVGDTYCSVIEACNELFDIRRVQAWTTALAAWCDAQPELIPFRGQCLVHRSEVLQFRGDWPTALTQARQACEQLSTPVVRIAVGAAHYQEGELYRLRGEFGKAEAAYRNASAAGRDPQPGLALLRLARGQVELATTSIHRALQETTDPVSRARLLPAAVETRLATSDVDGARHAADELSDVAAVLRAPLLRALAATADGRVLLATGEPQPALARLRDAASLWTELEAPYELARVRVQLGSACRALGDSEGATLELDAARAAFTRLGATADLAQLDPTRPALGLSAREIEVIRLIAAGNSNQRIADTLVISERTVERHVSNIFAKLGITSRAAATAFVYEHGLL